MQAALGFVEDERVGAAADDGDGLAGAFDTRDFDSARAGGLDFFDEIGVAKLVFGEGVDVGYWFAAGALVRTSARERVQNAREQCNSTLQMNSTSSLSMSLTAIMLSLARKCRLRSLTASRSIDFWMKRTLHFAFLIFLTMFRRYVRSSFSILSIWR